MELAVIRTVSKGTKHIALGAKKEKFWVRVNLDKGMFFTLNHEKQSVTVINWTTRQHTDSLSYCHVVGEFMEDQGCAWVSWKTCIAFSFHGSGEEWVLASQAIDHSSIFIQKIPFQENLCRHATVSHSQKPAWKYHQFVWKRVYLNCSIQWQCIPVYLNSCFSVLGMSASCH